MKTESTPPKDPPTPPSAVSKAASTSPAAATTALAEDGAPRAKKAGVGPVRTRAAPSKTFVCRGFGDCSMVFSRSEHLARHVRKHTGERPFACHCGKQFSRLDNLRQHAQTVHSDKADLNERMMRDLTSLHTALAASSHRNLPRLSPSQPTTSQGSRSQPSTPNDSHPPSNPFLGASPFGPTNPFGPSTFLSHRPFPRAIVPTPLSQTIDFNPQPLTFTLTLPDGTASDFHLPTPPLLMAPLSAPILGETDTIGPLSTGWMHATGPWTMAEGISPLGAEAAQGVGSLQSHPSSPESSTHNPFFPPVPRDPPPQVASPVGALLPDLSDALPPRQAAGSRPSMDARGLLQGQRQQLHHSASDPQLHHHARARAVASGASIGVGMYSPLSRQHWLPQDTTMGMGMIDRQGIEMGMGPLAPLASHLDSGLALHPRAPSTDRDGAESGSGSEPGMEATSRLSAEVDAASLEEMEMAMNAGIMARGDMSAQRPMAGMPSDWPLAMLLPPQTVHPIHRWNPDVENLEGFTQETPTERSDYYRPTGEDTTRRFPTIRQDSHPANGRMTLGLEMPPDQTQGPRLDDLPSWNYAQPSPHQMIMQQGLHSAFRPMASPPLSGDGSPRPLIRPATVSGGDGSGFPGIASFSYRTQPDTIHERTGSLSPGSTATSKIGTTVRDANERGDSLPPPPSPPPTAVGRRDDDGAPAGQRERERERLFERRDPAHGSSDESNAGYQRGTSVSDPAVGPSSAAGHWRERERLRGQVRTPISPPPTATGVRAGSSS
ncbi:hypothetical protein OPQ81_007251 [Rhizoctonia solani]|nr:hypothetical protein OPQ81_007251 [Rhizoctonia solani]